MSIDTPQIANREGTELSISHTCTNTLLSEDKFSSCADGQHKPVQCSTPTEIL